MQMYVHYASFNVSDMHVAKRGKAGRSALENLTCSKTWLINTWNQYLKFFCSWQQTYIFSVTLAMRSNTTDWLHNFEISSTTSPIYAIRLKTQCTKMKTLGRATISIFSNENQNLRQKVFNRGFAFVQGSLTFWNLTQFHLFKVLHNSIWRAWSFVCVD